MKIAIYPGTFDPITNGHIDVAARASKLFDKVIICVAVNSQKTPIFTGAERIKLVRDSLKCFKNIKVEEFDGLLVDYAKERNAHAIVRGLRAVSDFEYEFQMALTNRKLCSGIDTIFLMPHEKYTYLNSSIVREIAKFGGDVSQFVPAHVERELMKKFSRIPSMSPRFINPGGNTKTNHRRKKS